MYFATIIGTVWATVKDENLAGASFEIIQPIDAHRRPVGSPIVAVNTIGAGKGETVMYITASEASIPLPADMAPTDATIVGIVDRIDLDMRLSASILKAESTAAMASTAPEPSTDAAQHQDDLN